MPETTFCECGNCFISRFLLTAIVRRRKKERYRQERLLQISFEFGFKWSISLDKRLTEGEQKKIIPLSSVLLLSKSYQLIFRSRWRFTAFWNEDECGRVQAIPFACGCRAIIKYMSEVGATFTVNHCPAGFPKTIIFYEHYCIGGDWRVKTGPPSSGIEFRSRTK